MNRWNGKQIMMLTKIRLFNRKNLLLLVLIFCFMKIYLRPVINFSIISQCDVSPWIFPFLITDNNFLMVFMAGIVCIYSDIPFTQYWNSYCFVRCGRVRWIWGQISYIIFSSYMIVFGMILLSWIAMFPRVEFQNSWGKVIYTLAKTNAGSQSGMFWGISGQHISKYTACESMALSIVITGLGIAFMGILMFGVSLMTKKVCGLFTGSFLIIFSSVAANVILPIQKQFTLVSPVSLMRVARIGVNDSGYELMPSPFVICVLYLVGISMIIFVIFLKREKINLQWHREQL